MNAVSPKVLAQRGWAARLAALVAGGLVLLASTGLLAYLGPFGLGSQLGLLLHVVVGLLLAMSINRAPALLLRQESVLENGWLGVALDGTAASESGAVIGVLTAEGERTHFWGAEVSFASQHAAEALFWTGQSRQD